MIPIHGRFRGGSGERPAISTPLRGVSGSRFRESLLLTHTPRDRWRLTSVGRRTLPGSEAAEEELRHLGGLGGQEGAIVVADPDATDHQVAGADLRVDE